MPRPIHLSPSDFSRSECIVCTAEKFRSIAAAMPHLARCVSPGSSVIKMDEHAVVVMTLNEELTGHETQSQLMLKQHLVPMKATGANYCRRHAVSTVAAWPKKRALALVAAERADGTSMHKSGVARAGWCVVIGDRPVERTVCRDEWGHGNVKIKSNNIIRASHGSRSLIPFRWQVFAQGACVCVCGPSVSRTCDSAHCDRHTRHRPCLSTAIARRAGSRL